MVKKILILVILILMQCAKEKDNSNTTVFGLAALLSSQSRSSATSTVTGADTRVIGTITRKTGSFSASSGKIVITSSDATALTPSTSTDASVTPVTVSGTIDGSGVFIVDLKKASYTATITDGASPIGVFTIVVNSTTSATTNVTDSTNILLVTASAFAVADMKDACTNNSFAGATTLTVGTKVTSKVASGTYCYYKFTPATASTNTYTLTTTTTASLLISRTGQTSLSFATSTADSSTSSWYYTKSGTGNKTVSAISLNSSGTRYVVVSGVGCTTATCAFDLDLAADATTGTCATTAATATTLTSNTPVTISGQAENADCFFKAVSNGAILRQVTFLVGPKVGSAAVEMYPRNVTTFATVDGESLSTATASDTYKTGAITTQGGFRIFRVNASSCGGSTCSYSLYYQDTGL